MAIAPPLPRDSAPAPQASAAAGLGSSGAAAGPFRYEPDAEAFSFDFDPRAVRFDLLEGWDKEQQAFNDRDALAFISGPMYERFGEEGTASTVPLGDLKLGDRIWRGPNRSAARQRAFLGIRHDGRVEFGYGELSEERAAIYDTFIGGLHSIYNDLEPEPAQYKGAYSISMGQQIRYFLPRIRVIYGLRSDGRVAMLMSRDGLTLEQTKAMARERGFVAAYMPDHASKSRLIIPGVKGFSREDANWISGGATSFVHVPYMLRLSRRNLPLAGDVLATFTPRLPGSHCGHPLACASGLAGGLADRAMAGFNRLMERGVEPLARLIWAPLQERRSPGGSPQKAPLREPVITADPEPIQQRQQRDLAIRPAAPLSEPAPPQLPEPQPEAKGQAPAAAPSAVVKPPETPPASPAPGTSAETGSTGQGSAAGPQTPATVEPAAAPQASTLRAGAALNPAPTLLPPATPAAAPMPERSPLPVAPPPPLSAPPPLP